MRDVLLIYIREIYGFRQKKVRHTCIGVAKGVHWMHVHPQGGEKNFGGVMHPEEGEKILRRNL